MIGGHVDVFFGNVAAAQALYRDGRVKIVAVADTHRAPALPEIPTTAEAGLPGLVSTGWFALAAPPRLSGALQSEIADAAIAVIRMPDVQEKFRAASVEPVGNSPAETSATTSAAARDRRNVEALATVRVRRDAVGDAVHDRRRVIDDAGLQE